MPDNQTILTNFLTAVRTDVVNSMQASGRFATGETIANIDVEATDSDGQITAPWWIDALEKGRKPTSSGATAGDPPMIDRIKAWCAAKGIDDKAAWAIKKSIDKKGYPGKPGVLTEPLSDDNINSKLDIALELIAANMQHEIADIFNVFDKV